MRRLLKVVVLGEMSNQGILASQHCQSKSKALYSCWHNWSIMPWQLCYLVWKNLSMMQDNEPLTIFVAMPGTEQSRGGQSIPWPDPEAIERHFFQRIALKLKQDLQREVILHIERYEHLASVIHDSLFPEPWQSPVYIADLTGNNANVYLELGIRWALKERVTVLVSQTITDVKFDAAYAHVIPYSNDPILLEQAIDSVLKTIKEGLANGKHIDSPVILPKDTIIEAEIKAYQNKIELLEEKIKALTQGKKFLDSAKSAREPEERMLLYQSAIQANPTLMEAYLPLAQEQRKQGYYPNALVTLKQAIALFPTNAEFYREQGVTYNKKGQFEEAIQAFRAAVSLDDKDDEAWSNLGGLLRTIGTKSLSYNWDALREARDSYQKALKANDRNTYAQGNLARLDIMLSKVDPERFSLAIEEFEILEALCRLDLKRDPQNYWRWFDRADSYLLSGKVDEGYHLYAKAIELVPLEYRKSELSIVMSPLTNFLLLDVFLDDSVKVAVQKVVETLELLISGQIAQAKFPSGVTSTKERFVDSRRTQLWLG